MSGAAPDAEREVVRALASDGRRELNVSLRSMVFFGVPDIAGRSIEPPIYSLATSARPDESLRVLSSPTSSMCLGFGVYTYPFN